MPKKKKEVLDARERLRQKLKEKKLERVCKDIREKKMRDIEDILDESKNPKERKKLKEELELLEKIHEKQSNFSGEFPDYGDGACYGGGVEHND